MSMSSKALRSFSSSDTFWSDFPPPRPVLDKQKNKEKSNKGNTYGVANNFKKTSVNTVIAIIARLGEIQTLEMAQGVVVG
eukprot:m.33416 g.33416  ORF g.33416 m.33416 type:complete len:80 (-) comp9858_c3_seq12:2290-2529(-)